jgi:5-methylcytosine-specific restriction enzyme B
VEPVKARDHERVYEAADRFVEVALRSDNSLFTPGEAVWTSETLDDLHKRFVESPDTSSDPFHVKLERQLSGAADTTIELMAEVLYVHFLIASTVTGQRKRELIGLVLSWSSHEPEIPRELDQALDQGVVGVGTAFNTYRPFQLQR